ncbi:hypothetical protein ACYSNM_07935 [Myroides sp. LJL116]
MRIVDIFEVVEGSLFSVLFEEEFKTIGYSNSRLHIVGEQLHEFRRLFDFWNDPFQLRLFFEEHQQDLEDNYWEGITIDQAIEKTREEAKQLEAILLEYAEAGKTNRFETLSTLFKPLSNGRFDKEFEKDKVKVKGRKTWLRLYAIRVDVNFFVVCGGAIKLRETLNDREYLLKELKKLDITCNYLKDDSTDTFDLYEISH